MRGSKLPVSGMLFVLLLAVYLITFRIPLAAVFLTSGYFILIVMLGQAARFLVPNVESVLFQTWLLPALTGLGLFQLIWFLAKVMHLQHLILTVPLAFLSTLAALKLKPRNTPQVRDQKKGSLWIVTTLILCTIITYFPFKNFGKERDGFFHYRASFWAVSMKHLAVINTLGGDYPFTNPYFQGEPLHYYYLSYAFPAALKENGLTSEDALFGYQAVQAYLFVLLCLFFFQMQTRTRGQPFFLTFILIFSVSVEGLYYVGRHLSRFLENPLFFRNLVHFDGVSNVLISQPPIDTLHRAILFTPMHLQALTFLMLSLMLVKRNRFSLASAVMAFSFLSSFFIGGVGFLMLGIHLLWTLTSGRFSRSSLISLASSAVLSLAFVKATAMLGSVASSVSFVFPQASKLLWIIGLNFGLVFVLALIAYPLEWKKSRDGFTAALLISFALAFIFSFFLRIEPLGNEFPLKLSLVLQLLLVAGLAFLGRFQKTFTVIALVIILAGLPTFLGDIYCAQDISSAHTLKVPIGEMNMARWINRNLGSRAVVQTYPSAREWFFSIVPVFAGRDTLVGDAMHGIAFQVAPEAYKRRLQETEAALTRINEPEDREYLRKSGVTHLFFGSKEAQKMPVPAGLKVLKKTAGTRLYSLE